MTDKLNEMWTALAAYQDKADAAGHGESWAMMCSEKTEDAANSAWYAERGSAYAGLASHAAEAAASYAAQAESAADASIDYITKAKEKQND